MTRVGSLSPSPGNLHKKAHNLDCSKPSKYPIDICLPENFPELAGSEGDSLSRSSTPTSPAALEIDSRCETGRPSSHALVSPAIVSHTEHSESHSGPYVTVIQVTDDASSYCESIETYSAAIATIGGARPRTTVEWGVPNKGHPVIRIPSWTGNDAQSSVGSISVTIPDETEWRLGQLQLGFPNSARGGQDLLEPPPAYTSRRNSAARVHTFDQIQALFRLPSYRKMTAIYELERRPYFLGFTKSCLTLFLVTMLSILAVMAIFSIDVIRYSHGKFHEPDYPQFSSDEPNFPGFANLPENLAGKS